MENGKSSCSIKDYKEVPAAANSLRDVPSLSLFPSLPHSLPPSLPGYTAGAIDAVCRKVLTERRKQRLPIKPLANAEFIPHLAKIDPVFKDEYEQFSAWSAKNNPQVRCLLRVLG